MSNCHEKTNINTELNENELDEVTGGSINEITCFFTPKGGSKTINGNVWLECNSKCLGFLRVCACNGTPDCEERWHRISEDRILFPWGGANHSKKKPPNYNT